MMFPLVDRSSGPSDAQGVYEVGEQRDADGQRDGFGDAHMRSKATINMPSKAKITAAMGIATASISPQHPTRG
jgi:hypothetical protein